MDQLFSVSLDYGDFFIWDPAVNNEGPKNTILLNVINCSDKILSYYNPGKLPKKDYVYLSKVFVSFNFGTGKNCLMEINKVSGLKYKLHAPWGASRTESIIANSSICFDTTKRIVLPNNINENTVFDLEPETLTNYLFEIENIVSETEAGLAVIKVELEYYLDGGDELVMHRETFGFSILKQLPQIRIAAFYAQSRCLTQVDYIVLHWNVPCADYCQLEMNHKLMENEFENCRRFDYLTYDDANFVLIAQNKSGYIRYADHPIYIDFEPPALEMTVNGEESVCNVMFNEEIHVHWKCVNYETAQIVLQTTYYGDKFQYFSLDSNEGDMTFKITPGHNMLNGDVYKLVLVNEFPVKGDILTKEIEINVINAIAPVYSKYFELLDSPYGCWRMVWNIPQTKDIPIYVKLSGNQYKKPGPGPGTGLHIVDGYKNEGIVFPYEDREDDIDNFSIHVHSGVSDQVFGWGYEIAWGRSYGTRIRFPAIWE